MLWIKPNDVFWVLDVKCHFSFILDEHGRKISLLPKRNLEPANNFENGTSTADKELGNF